MFSITVKLDHTFSTIRQKSLLFLFFSSYFFSSLNVGQEQPCFPMSGFMNSHSQCPKICKTTILTLVKKEITLNEFNEDLKKCPWRCSLNENVIMSTFCLVPYWGIKKQILFSVLHLLLSISLKLLKQS